MRIKFLKNGCQFTINLSGEKYTFTVKDRSEGEKIASLILK